MGRLGIILGSGSAGIELTDDIVVIARHGGAMGDGSGEASDPGWRSGGYALPHEIDHETNLRMLAEQGCDRIVGVSSVGSLRRALVPGTVVVPDDFIALDNPPLTTFPGDPRAHRAPAFDPELRRALVSELGDEAVDGGVYWQVPGPRLETPAEVRFIAPHADVVGMTVASECIVAGEMGLGYAALCMVDNLATGIGEGTLSVEEIAAGQKRNRKRLAAALKAAIDGL